MTKKEKAVIILRILGDGKKMGITAIWLRINQENAMCQQEVRRMLTRMTNNRHVNSDLTHPFTWEITDEGRKWLKANG